jgi:predicted ATPase
MNSWAWDEIALLCRASGEAQQPGYEHHLGAGPGDRALLVAGEAGVGKSRLIRQFAGRGRWSRWAVRRR